MSTENLINRTLFSASESNKKLNKKSPKQKSQTIKEILADQSKISSYFKSKIASPTNLNNLAKLRCIVQQKVFDFSDKVFKTNLHTVDRKIQEITTLINRTAFYCFKRDISGLSISKKVKCPLNKLKRHNYKKSLKI